MIRLTGTSCHQNWKKYDTAFLIKLRLKPFDVKLKKGCEFSFNADIFWQTKKILKQKKQLRHNKAILTQKIGSP
jgi:hypothetical protein